MLARLVPAAALGAAALLFASVPAGGTLGVPVERALARGLVAAFLAAVVFAAASLARGDGAPAAASPRARAVALAAALATLALGLGLSGAVRPATGAGTFLALGESWGPLTLWPALRAQAGGFAFDLGVGRLLVLGTTAAAAGLAAVALARRRAAGACALAPPVAGLGLAGLAAPAACAGCAPLAVALVAAAATGAAAPSLDPASAAGALVDLLPPALALGVLAAAARPATPTPPRRGRRAALAVAAAVAAVPVAQALGMPSGASSRQEAIHGLFWLAMAGAIVLTALTIGLLVAFALKYRDGGTARAWEGSPRRRRVLGTAFFVVPTVVIFGVGAVSFGVLLDLENAPPADVEVKVQGLRFAWQFTYPDGESSVNELRVAEDRVVVLNVTSADVIHSLFVPDLGVKMDANPGAFTLTWFRASQPGTYPAVCAEFCGVGHAEMRASVVVFPAGSQARPYGDVR